MLHICPFCAYHGSTLEDHLINVHTNEVVGGSTVVEESPERDWEAFDADIDELLFDVFVGGPYDQRQVEELPVN